MDLALLLSTFVTVFLAELGDKTQLATVALSGTSDRPLAVFLGSSSALVLASLIGAFEEFRILVISRLPKGPVTTPPFTPSAGLKPISFPPRQTGGNQFPTYQFPP